MRGCGALLWLCACGRVSFDELDGGAMAADAFACQRLVPPTDDFEQPGLTEYVTYVDPGTMQAEIGGQLELTPASASGTGAYTGVISAARAPFRDVAVMVELVQVPVNALGVQCSMYIGELSTGTLGFMREGDTLFILPLPDSTPYSPTNHRWLRIRESAGTVYFEAAAAPPDWTVLTTTPAPAWLDGDVPVALEAGSYRSVASPGAARFDNLNVPPCP